MTPTLRQSVLRIVANAFPALAYGYPRTYIVASVAGDGRLDLVPPPDAAHLAELASVAPYTIAGVAIAPVVGSEVLVAFADADPRRPRVVGYAQGVPTDASVNTTGTLYVGPDATLVDIGSGSETLSAAAAVGRVVRYGDAILFGAPGAGVVTLPAAGPVATVKA